MSRRVVFRACKDHFGDHWNLGNHVFYSVFGMVAGTCEAQLHGDLQFYVRFVYCVFLFTLEILHSKEKKDVHGWLRNHSASAFFR